LPGEQFVDARNFLKSLHTYLSALFPRVVPIDIRHRNFQNPQNLTQSFTRFMPGAITYEASI